MMMLGKIIIIVIATAILSSCAYVEDNDYNDFTIKTYPQIIPRVIEKVA